MPPVSPEPNPPAGKAPPQLPAGVEAANLPDAPTPEQPASVVTVSQELFRLGGEPPPKLVGSVPPIWSGETETHPGPYRRLQLRRSRILNSSQRFLDTTIPIPMTSEQKLFIASTDVIDPFNLVTLVGSSAYFVATTAHSAYGPGLPGFGRNVGYSLAQDLTGEFFGAYAIPSVVHQDPRYYRMPGAPISRRVLHAIVHTVVGQHDDGSRMPNYAILGTYPLSAVVSNLYVPGLHTDPRSTAARVAVGLASDPADALINEFLPDVAKRVHIRIVFFQQILNNISAAPTTQ